MVKAVSKDLNDLCEPFSDESSYLLIVKAKNPEQKVYVIDYRNVMEPRTLPITIKKSLHHGRFNLYSAILPSLENVRDRQTHLAFGSFEY